MEIIIESTIGEKMINPEVVKIIKDNGYSVVGDNYLKSLLDSELELVKLKSKLKKENSNGKTI